MFSVSFELQPEVPDGAADEISPSSPTIPRQQCGIEGAWRASRPSTKARAHCSLLLVSWTILKAESLNYWCLFTVLHIISNVASPAGASQESWPLRRIHGGLVHACFRHRDHMYHSLAVLNSFTKTLKSCVTDTY